LQDTILEFITNKDEGSIEHYAKNLMQIVSGLEEGFIPHF